MRLFDSIRSIHEKEKAMMDDISNIQALYERYELIFFYSPPPFHLCGKALLLKGRRLVNIVRTLLENVSNCLILFISFHFSGLKTKYDLDHEYVQFSLSLKNTRLEWNIKLLPFQNRCSGGKVWSCTKFSPNATNSIEWIFVYHALFVQEL